MSLVHLDAVVDEPVLRRYRASAATGIALVVLAMSLGSMFWLTTSLSTGSICLIVLASTSRPLLVVPSLTGTSDAIPGA